MKFLIAGEGHFPIYEHALSRVLEGRGHSVKQVAWSSWFCRTGKPGSFAYKSGLHRLEARLAVGPHVTQFNGALREIALEFEPDVIFLYNAALVLAKSIKSVKKLLPDAIVVGYANDNPFSKAASSTYWRHYKDWLSECHLVLGYRPSDLPELRRLTREPVRLWRSACTQQDLVVGQTATEQQRDLDVVFLGHFEPDGRAEILECLRENGVQVLVRGGQWHELRKKTSQIFAQHYSPISVHEYRELLGRSKVALSFLSERNRDSYTRRNFEIPACGAAQVSVWSSDLASLFPGPGEIVFADSAQDFVKEVKTLLEDDDRRRAMAKAGRERIVQDGHYLDARVENLLVYLRDLFGVVD